MATADLLYKYRNGDCIVSIFSDGTKIRKVLGEDIEQPELIDLKITNYCDHQCPYCCENSNRDGSHCKINDVIEMVDGLLPGTELAIEGGNPMENPDLYYFLTAFQHKGFISNITVNMIDFFYYEKKILQWQEDKKLYRVGVSVPVDVSEEDAKKLQHSKCNHMIIHTIAGIHDWELVFYFSKLGFKVLILGYKTAGRGKNNCLEEVNYKIESLRTKMPHILAHANAIISFDNLAIEQLEIKKWESYYNLDNSYIGDDGNYSFFIDAVDMKYAISSTQHRIKIPKNSTIKTLFQSIRGVS